MSLSGESKSVEMSLCAPKGLITSGGRTHTNSWWLDSVAGERQYWKRC